MLNHSGIGVPTTTDKAIRNWMHVCGGSVTLLKLNCFAGGLQASSTLVEGPLPRMPSAGACCARNGSAARGGIQSPQCYCSFCLRDVTTCVDADLIALTDTLGGTQRRHTRRPATGKHFEVRWVYRETHFSNKSAGVSILLNNRKWQAKHVTRILDPGRGASVQRGCNEGKTKSLRQ